MAARCVLLTESCSLFLTCYSRAAVASLFSHVICWSLHVFADWSSLLAVCYFVIRFSTRKCPPHWCSSLAGVCLLFISQHANRLLHLVSRCSHIPVRNLLFYARRSLRPPQFLFLASLCIPLRSFNSYLAARRLLLYVFNFFNFN